MIVAMSLNHVIGKENTMPWHMPSDLAHFKRLTMGHVMIMGKNTYLSIGKPLPGRTTWVLSTSMEPSPGITIFESLDEILAKARKLDQERFFIVGGGTLYASLMSQADELYVTEIETTLEGDTFFPSIDAKRWELIQSEPHPANEKNSFPYTFKLFKANSRS